MAASRTSYLLTAALVLTALAVASIALFGGGDGDDNDECVHGECGPQGLGLPTTTLRYSRVPAPDTTIALFVDLSSHASRRLFTTILRAIDQGDVDSAELLLFHAPTDCHDSKPDDDQAYACAAALTVECAEKQRPGAGLLLAARTLDDLWQSSPNPDLSDLRELLDSTEDLGLDRDALDTCAERVPSVPTSNPNMAALRVRVHHEWARQRGLQQSAGGFIIRREGPRERFTPFGESLTRVELGRLWGCTGIVSAATCDRKAEHP